MANDWNQQIIDEFRANGGKVGGNFEGSPMLILHTKGTKTGLERETPVMYRTVDGGDVAVFASYAGAPQHPAWYGNLVADPEITIEIGSETRRVRARVAAGDERTRIWEAQKAEFPGFAEYEAKTDREIPVVVLEPVG
jgi:deazaflavin-dependent oxidoreductase (nitroreductase family)